MNSKFLMSNDEADFSKFLSDDAPRGWVFAYKNACNVWITQNRMFADKREAKKAVSRLIRSHPTSFENTDFMFAFVQD